jgi:hypothetical protein
MPRRCSICDHPQRKRIDVSLLRASYRSVAQQFGLSESAVFRHRQDHLTKRLTLAAAEGEQLTAVSLLAEWRSLQARAEGLLNKTESKGDFALAIRAVSELRALLVVAFKVLEASELEQRLSALEQALQQRRLSA